MDSGDSLNLSEELGPFAGAASIPPGWPFRGEQFYGNEYVDSLVRINTKNLDKFRKQMTYYLRDVFGMQDLLQIWVADSIPFNSFNYPENDSLDAKYRIITESHQYGPITRLFQKLGIEVNTMDKHQVVTAFASIRDWLNKTILAAPRFEFPLYLFRLTKIAGLPYEFDQGQPGDKFMSYTMFPFGSTINQDLVSVTYFSDEGCCFSIAELPPGAPFLYIPNEFTSQTADEIITPLSTQKTGIQYLGEQSYTYTPVVAKHEIESGVNLISTLKQQELASIPWSLAFATDDIIKSLYIFNSLVKIYIKTYQYSIIPPTSRGSKKKKSKKKKSKKKKSKKKKTKKSVRRNL